MTLASTVKGEVTTLDSTVKGRVLVWATSVGDIFGAATEMESPTLDGSVAVSPEDVSMTTLMTDIVSLESGDRMDDRVR